MTAGTQSTAAPQNATFREVFAQREFRALWLAQLASIAGDQFARVALAVLVYDHTGSPLLAAVTFAVTAAAQFAGGLGLGWVADQYPRRRVMVTSDVACLALVLVMTIPGLPLGVLIGLLFTVTLSAEPFMSARSATNREILGPDRFQLGRSITLSTYQAATLGGFAVGGVVAGLAGPRPALLIDAASFGASALLIRFGVKARPAADPVAGPAEDQAATPGKPQLLAGARIVLASPVARTATLLIWLIGFADAAEGVSVPLAHQFGGGAAAAGWLLAAMAAGSAAAEPLFTRLVAEDRRMRFAAVLAAASCAVLLLFTVAPDLAIALVILAASGLCAGYIASAGGALMNAIPSEHYGKADGFVGAGMSLGQGVLIIAAGAAAQQIRPSLVIAACGAAGLVTAIPLALTWRRVRPST